MIHHSGVPDTPFRTRPWKAALAAGMPPSMNVAQGAAAFLGALLHKCGFFVAFDFRDEAQASVAASRKVSVK